ncbi:MAG: hypothetical protein AAGI63_02055 [Planctomycetota bacterium]
MDEKPFKSCRRYVDMWALPGIHASNIEFLQKLKTADSNHFNTHMDVVGTVLEQDEESGDWEKTHLVGLRTDIWKADEEELQDALEAMRHQRKRDLKKKIKKHGRLNEKQRSQLQEQLDVDEVMNSNAGDIEARRLVLKLFKTTTDRVRWCGTIEQVTTTEVHHSIGSNRPLLAMAVLLPRTQFVTDIQQNHRTFRVPSVFSSCFYDDERMWHLILRRRWVSLGADFDIEIDGEPVGDVDGRLISFGSDSYINMDAHPLAENTRFMDLMTLFAASVGYHKAMRKSVRRRVNATLDGKSHLHRIDDEELRLRHNGRAAA